MKTDKTKPCNDSAVLDPGKDFKLERYKFILQEIHTLNDNQHKYLNLFQVLITAIIGGGVLVFVSWQQAKISADAARVAIHGLMWVLVILAAFLFVSIIAGAFSWFDYREEETKLLNEVVGTGFRKRPTWANFWRWNETYVLLFVSIAVIVIVMYVERRIIPFIQ